MAERTDSVDQEHLTSSEKDANIVVAEHMLAHAIMSVLKLNEDKEVPNEQSHSLGPHPSHPGL